MNLPKPRQPCSFDGCDRLRAAKDLCQTHYKQQLLGKPLTPFTPKKSKGSQRDLPCQFNECEHRARTHMLCDGHYSQERSGKELRALTKPLNRFIDKNGYVYLSNIDHPNAKHRGRIAEHRLIMSNHLGRPLLPHENVHHINGDKLDNRIENLELWSRSQPSGQRIKDKTAWAKEWLAIYEPEALRQSHQ